MEGSMQKSIWLLALVAALLLSGGAAQADDGFYVIGGGRVGTRINTLPYPINSPGFYYLGGNLTTSGDGITVNVDNVTIDLMGFTLSHTGPPGSSNGIYMNGRNNVEIRNGTISGFFGGIFETSFNSNNHRVINIRALNPGANGSGANIGLDGVNHLVKDCFASGNAYGGIGIDGGTISGCVSVGNSGYGISITVSGSILDNVAKDNPGNGFSVPSGNALVDGNSASGNGTNYSAGGTGTVWGVNAGH
jgi:hypothetical protein